MTRVLKDPYTPLQTPRLNLALSSQPGWGKDYADASTFFTPLFDGRNIIAKNNTNYSLLGITPAIAKKVGATATSPRHRASMPTSTSARPTVETRIACYSALDKKLTTQIVPWVPYLWSYAQTVVSQERDAVGLRSVRRDDRLRTRGGQVTDPSRPLAPRQRPGRQRAPSELTRCCSTSSGA